MSILFGFNWDGWSQISGPNTAKGMFNGRRPHGSAETLFRRLLEPGYDSYLGQYLPMAGEADSPAHPFASALNVATHDFGLAQIIAQPDYGVGRDGSTGAPIVKTVVDYTPRMISQTVVSQDALDATGVANGIDDYSGEGFVSNLATTPGKPSYTGLFVLFGQFLDHGLDLIGRGGNYDPVSGSPARIIIPFAESDPLFAMSPDGQFSITRSTVTSFDKDGVPVYTNHTSPTLDQNQTYGSDPAVTELLREWVEDPNAPGTFIPGMRMLSGYTLENEWTRWDGAVTNQTLPTVTELRIAVHETLNPALGRTDLTFADIFDYHGTGQALLLDFLPVADAIDTSSEMNIFGDAPNILFEVNLGSLLILTQESPGDPTSRMLVLGIQPGADPVLAGEAMLQAIGSHYVAGDGRVNENVGLTSVHHMFNQEHNFQVDYLIDVITAAYARGDYRLDQLHAWQTPVRGARGRPLIDIEGNYVDAEGAISWNLDRIFEAAKLIVQIEDRQIVIEQYARLVSPDITAISNHGPASGHEISLEFSQAAFRFGHSQLRETVDAIDPEGSIAGQVMQLALASAFLSPDEFAEIGPGAFALGMSHQLGAETDEFVTATMQQSLLGQPLDLPAINIARGRDVGLPTLNATREQISQSLQKSGMSLSGDLEPYSSWNDFGANMLHSESLIHFIAAYSFDGDIGAAAAAMSDDVFMSGDNQDFQKIDLWIGGLAERHVEGGILGATFNAIFVDQLSRQITDEKLLEFAQLQAALPEDMNLASNILALQFKDIVERTTDAEHLAGNVFQYADDHLDLVATPDAAEIALRGTDLDTHKYGDLIVMSELGVYSDTSDSNANNGWTVDFDGTDYIFDGRPNAILGPDGVAPIRGFDAHEVIVGSGYADVLHAGGGFDTLYGDAGNDMLFGDDGDDFIYGESGNDVLEGGAGSDHIDGGPGDDTVVFGGLHSDYLIVSVGVAHLITDNRTGSPDGTDIVMNVETAKFADQVIDFVGLTGLALTTGFEAAPLMILA